MKYLAMKWNDAKLRIDHFEMQVLIIIVKIIKSIVLAFVF